VAYWVLARVYLNCIPTYFPHPLLPSHFVVKKNHPHFSPSLFGPSVISLVFEFKVCIKNKNKLKKKTQKKTKKY
jgi:hypothetical protein